MCGEKREWFALLQPKRAYVYKKTELLSTLQPYYLKRAPKRANGFFSMCAIDMDGSTIKYKT